MSDIFRIDTSDGIKLTGGVQQEGICTTTDSRDVRTRTELESGAQNAGGNDSSPNGGISEVYVSGCLTGSGTEANPLSIVINPTGGIACGEDGLYVTNVVVVTGVTATSVITSGCVSGSGTAGSPISVLINPTGGIQCTVAGLALQQTYLTSVTKTNCLSGSGTAASPLGVLLNPTGGIQCTADGLAVQFPVPTGLNNVSTSGSCLSGNGTAGSPLALVINPTGKLHCTAAGIALQETYLTQAITSGCIAGIGTVGSPIVLSINATGGLHCTPGGLAIQSTYLTSVTPTGCLSGSGTLASPLAIRLSATGGLNCVSDGLALQNIFSSIVSSGCLFGSGTLASPVVLSINPTGGLHCTPNGLAINATIASTVVTSGCITGSGTSASPVSLLINPTGSLECTANGLAFNGVTTSGVSLIGNGTPASALAVRLNPTGGLQVTAAGIGLQETYLTRAVTSGCVSGSGTVSSPITILLNPTGGIQCTPDGLAINSQLAGSGISSVAISGCLGGDGTTGNPLYIAISPTGGLQCTASGLGYAGVTTSGTSLIGVGTISSPLALRVNPTGGLNVTAAGVALQEVYLTQVITSGCVAGIGTVGSPIVLSINPTGGIHCTPGGIAINAAIASSVVTSGCLTGSGTVGNPILILLNPTGGLHCTPNGLAINASLTASSGGICNAYSYESGIAPLAPSQPTTPISNLSSGNVQVEVYDNVTRYWFYNGSAFILDKEFSGGGTSTPSSPVNSIQFNNGGAFGGSANLTWDGSTLSVTGNITTKNVANLVYTIVDGTGVDINPSNGGFQVWTLGSGRVPTANSFAQGQSVTLLLDDGSGYNVDWTTIGVNWLGGTAPALATSGYTVVDLFKIGSTVYGLSTTSGTTGTGTPASPVNSIQYNSAGSFGGSSNLLWTGSELSVTGVVSTKNVNSTVYTITDGTGVDIDPDNGGIQVWVLTSGRTPTASSFDQGQSVTLMIDDGSGYTVNWGTIGVNWLAGSAPTLATSGYTVVELWKVGSTIYGASSVDVASSSGSSPGGSDTQVQFNNAGSFGGAAGLTWNGTGVTISGASLTASSPGLTVAQTWNSGTVAFTGVLVNINDTNSSSTSKLLDLQVGGNSVFRVSKIGDVTAIQFTAPYFATTSAASAGFYVRSTSDPTFSLGTSDDVKLTRDAADRLALRRGTNSQALYVYNNYISTGVYERAGIDWAGSPGVLQIGTQHAGSGVPRGLQLITSGTPRIDIQAGGAIQFYGAYTFPSTNGASGQVLTTNGAGTLTWGNVSGAASSADYFIDEVDEGNSGTSFTVNFGTKANHKLTLTGHCTLSFTAPSSARETKIRFVQGGTGGYSITLPSGTLGTTPVLPTGVGSQSVVTLFYDRDGNWHV